MEFTIKTKNNKSNDEITISRDTVNEIINLLHRVDCTAVWSDYDQSYIKVKDVPEDLVNNLIVKLQLIG